ncbi:M1 family metallopeptidase [Calderihabitans maritimus]|uniref:Peptidase M1 family protein n=1 Tax=Calderihabitans maritimus TaxID=1246530 RepID=A0A1Z5HUC6_9FIRM|nr:M1 family metallopeptidase [Calderihabitans maritimus]GAW93124.1 peptidase M1 family protein [Calderihabitans maritimus]
MKWTTLILLGIVIFLLFLWQPSVPKPAPVRTEPESSPAVAVREPFYRIEARLEGERRLEVRQQVEFTYSGGGRVRFHFWPLAFSREDTTPAPPEAYPYGFDAGAVDLHTVTTGGQKVDPEIEGVLITVPLTGLDLGEKATVTFEYTLEVPRVRYRYGYADHILNLGNWFPILAPEGHESTKYPPVGDPFTSLVGNYEVKITVPQKKIVAAGTSGEEQTHKDETKTIVFQGNNMRDFALVISSDFVVARRQVDGVVVYAYSPEGFNHVRRLVNTAVDVLQYYAAVFGPYPYPSLAVAETSLYPLQGMEYPGLVMISSREVITPKRLQWILAHEIAHQWWYGAVGNDQLQEPWIDEGLATYSAYLYMENLYGKENVEKPWERKETQAALLDFYQPVTAFQERTQYIDTVYHGAALYWDTLEQFVGREKVLRLLKELYHKYRFKIINGKEMMNFVANYK